MENAMKFTYEAFSCDVDIFRNHDDVVIRFYDATKEQTEEQIVNLVIVASGFGFLCFKRKGESGLVSGFLDKKIFSSDEMVGETINFLEKCCDVLWGYVPWHVDRVALVDYDEYNGEY